MSSASSILKREMQFGRRVFIVWTAIAVVFIGFYLGFSSHMQDPSWLELIDAYPEALLEAFSIRADTITDVNLWHAVVMGFVLLVTTVFALMLAGSLIARDSDLGTAEFLYTKPVTRGQVMAAKAGAFVVSVVLLWLVAFAVSAAVGLTVAPGQFNLRIQAVVHLAGLLATLAAGGIGFAAGPLLDRTQSTTSLAAALGVGFFLLDAVSNTTDRLGSLRYVTLQYYAGLSEAAAGKPFAVGMLVLLLVSVAGFSTGYALLSRKDFSS